MEAKITAEMLDQIAKEMTDKGKLIEAGWIGLRIAAIPLDAPALQIEEMRNAFFAGAQHLFSSIMGILDPGEEPTEADMKRMDLISDELEGFIQKYKLKHFPADGRA